VAIAAQLPWWGAFALGVITFGLFYFGVPWWLDQQLSAQEGSRMYPVLEPLFERRFRLFQWIGIASGLVGLFFTIRNYFYARHASSTEQRWVAFLSRLLGRRLD